MPQAFGTFEHNLTLTQTVCAQCNSFFSRELEPWLARDTLEGYDRYLHGQKAPIDFKSMGTKSTSRIQISEGPYAGAWGYTSPGDERLGARPFPQVGFASEAAGPFEWFPLSDLPTKESLKSKGYANEVHVRLCECDDLDEARTLLARQGVVVGDTMSFDAPSGITRVEHVFRPGLIHRRGFAKIVFNYMAHQTGPAIALEARFDGLRQLVMTGTEPDHQYFSIDEEPIVGGDKVRGRLHGHIIVVQSRGNYVEGVVSPYNRFRHGFRLGLVSGAPVGPFGHFFDITNRAVSAMAPPATQLL
jgi:hypothetical protein